MRTKTPIWQMPPANGFGPVATASLPQSRAAAIDRCLTALAADGQLEQLQEAFRDAAALSAALADNQSQIGDLIQVAQRSDPTAFAPGLGAKASEPSPAAIDSTIRAKSLAALVHIGVCDQCNGEPYRRDLHDEGLSVNGYDGAMADTARPLPVDLSMIADYSSEMIRINLAEVQHRVKNMVAVIQSISHQTMRQSASKDDFDVRFSARLDAYCRSLDLLISNEWRVLNIDDVVRSQLTTFGLLDGTQITVLGPKLKLLPGPAHSIGLALHELATNAVKYGSLSVDGGRVAVRWWLVTAGNVAPRFHMTWQELDGPAVCEPVRRGFGRQMIEQLTGLALAGKTAHEFRVSGVTWALDAPAAGAIAI